MIIEEHDNLMFGIVEQAKRTNRTRRDWSSDVCSSDLGEAKFSFAQNFFEWVYVEIMIAMNNNKIMFVAFMIAKKQIFAMRACKTLPILPSYLDGWCFGVFKIILFDIELLQSVVNYLLSNHYVYIIL